MPGRLNRRSFVRSVTGSAFVVGGALSAVVSNGYAQELPTRSCLTDTDSGDRPDYGGRTGLTDADNSDAPDRGTLTERTDIDSSDAVSRGRSYRCEGQGLRTGLTDSDSGVNADLAGYGRGGSSRGSTAVTDSDSGNYADAAGYGRRGSGGIRDPAGSTRTPQFPRWPPPRASARTELDRELFVSDRNLSDVADRLVVALRATGNSRASFYTAPGGFVLVARLERIRDDARPAAGAERFIEPRPGEAERPDDPLGFVKALFFAPEGRYRQVIFVVTDRPVGEGDWTLSSDSASELLEEGSLDLLGPSRTTPFGPNYRVTALIYEFSKQGEGQAVVNVPGRWNAHTHLTRSGVLANLRS